MKIINSLFKSCRVVLSVERNIVRSVLNVSRTSFTQSFGPNSYVNTRAMSQKAITSFFKITPKKSSPDSTEKHKDESFASDEVDKIESPTSNGNAKKTSKRQRAASSDSESPKSSKSASSPVSSDKKKKAKRQRIESSGSEDDSPKSATKESPVKSLEVPSPDILTETVKLEKVKPKTYESPKAKRGRKKKAISSPGTDEKTEEKENRTKSPLPLNDVEMKNEDVSKEEERTSPVKIKEEKTTPEGKKKRDSKINGHSPSSPKDVKKEKSPAKKETKKDEEENTAKKETPPKKRNPFEMMKGKAASTNNENEAKTVNGDENGLVPEENYNPGKVKYHPIKDACWAKGQAVPYLALAKTLEVIEATSARLKMVEILSNYFRSVIVLTPEDLLPSIYMCLNQLAPAYHSLELGIAETYLMKAVGQCTGRSLAQVRAGAARAGAGGLAAVAERARRAQRTMFAQTDLTARKVFAALKEIASMTGPASVNKKISKIQSLYVACRHSEARYLIRSLEGKLRVGLAEQSLLQALALAAARSPPAGEHAGELDVADKMNADKFKARVEEFALTLKTTYCECPNYEEVVAALLREGVPALPRHCRLTPGVPLKPMLAHPTKGVHEVFARFDKEQFTCEWKYDGERAQIHVPGDSAPDFARAAIFSRNQENNTSKYPDILKRLPSLLKESVTSCVLDCEVVAYDTQTKQILPFQVLATRKRKGKGEAEGEPAVQVQVQVCVFVFDVLFLNGRALVRDPLLLRRRLLREHFNEHEGTWQWARGADCNSAEEVQEFLELAVRGSCEGLMVKTLTGDNARYDIARRSRNWLKLKKDYLEGVGDTIDVVVIGAYRGKGRRAGVYGGFLLACREPLADQYQSLCKIGTGFSDEDLRTLTDTLDKHLIDAPRNYYRFDSSHAADAWFAAACVWEVRCADLSLSPAHHAAQGLVDPQRGLSLRFPRFIRVREDKRPEEATSAQQIAEMYLAQDQVRNTHKQINYDDFY